MNLMMNFVECKPTFGVSIKCLNIFYEVDAIYLSMSLSLSLTPIYIYIYIVGFFFFFFFAFCLRSKTLLYLIEYFPQ
jgi:hypothetical protein